MGDPVLTDWWQREFTDGVDPEYTEQIIPLIWRPSIPSSRQGPSDGCSTSAPARPGRTGTGEPGARWSVSIRSPPRSKRRCSEPVDRPTDLPPQAGLPFVDASFDAAVACLVFEHIDEVDEAINEVARVVRPGGHFVFLLNHPAAADAGERLDRRPDHRSPTVLRRIPVPISTRRRRSKVQRTSSCASSTGHCRAT
ncbi:MAG: class I SAM-dependent methyltransferase [Acidimicrobiales bacterium]